MAPPNASVILLVNTAASRVYAIHGTGEALPG